MCMCVALDLFLSVQFINIIYTFITMPGFCFHVQAMGSNSDGEMAQSERIQYYYLAKLHVKLNLILMMFKKFETNKR